VVGAFNILRKAITLSPRKGIGVIGWKPSQGLDSNVALNLSALTAPRAL